MTRMPHQYGVRFLTFRKAGNAPILSTPKGGGGFRDGWDYNKERTRGGATMNYKFKLSRRMARFRAALPIATFFLGVSCAGDPSGPGSTEAAGPSNIRISPDSVSLGVNQTVQFEASSDARWHGHAVPEWKGTGTVEADNCEPYDHPAEHYAPHRCLKPLQCGRHAERRLPHAAFADVGPPRAEQ